MCPLAVSQQKNMQKSILRILMESFLTGYRQLIAPKAQTPPSIPCSFIINPAMRPPYDGQVPSSLDSDPLMCSPAHQWPDAKHPCRAEDPIWYTQISSYKKDRKCYQTPSLLIAVLFLLLVSLIFFNIYHCVLTSPDVLSCPEGWHEHMGRCYFFSNTEASWIFSQSNCSAFRGSLLMFDTVEEMEYVIRTQIHLYNWIGLQREDVGQPWHLTNDSVLGNRFPIRGEGRCAYLNEDEISSTWCDNRRYWICRKSKTLK